MFTVAMFFNSSFILGFLSSFLLSLLANKAEKLIVERQTFAASSKQQAARVTHSLSQLTSNVVSFQIFLKKYSRVLFYNFPALISPGLMNATQGPCRLGLYFLVIW